MTLYRQLIFFTLILFFILFTGTWIEKLNSTRSFLVDQLSSHAQDTATSLGLSISQHVREEDMIVVETMISAVFDRGYYQEINFTNTDGNVLIEKILDVKIEDVPDWFIQCFPLNPPEATSNVMAGWRQAGIIYVKSHPGYAYKTLWEDAVRVTFWFFICGVFVLIAGGFGIRVLLRPLVLVERQADALCRKEYKLQEHLPRTKELRHVVEAMNRMTRKVKEMFEEQVVQAEGLRLHAYNDPLTGLGNRRYLETQVVARLDRMGSTTRGIFMIVQINNLEKLNQAKGFQAGDELLKKTASLIRACTAGYSSCVLARLTGGDFSIFLPDAPPWDAEAIAEDIAHKLGGLASENISISDNVGHVGAATYECSTTLARLLSEADNALRTAGQTGPNSWNVRSVTEESEKMPMGQQQWKELLELAMKDHRIRLMMQPVVNTRDRGHLLHLEIFSRIVQLDGELLSAGVFMPFAEQLKLVSTLDKIVLEEVSMLDKETIGIDNVAVNISPASLQDESFQAWIKSFLPLLPGTAPRITFEFPEYTAVQNLNLVKEFSIFVRQNGHQIGLDHYGQSFSHLGYLKTLRPDYVKIDRAYTGELKNEESDSRFFIGSLCSVAHSIDIQVLAEAVETQLQWQILDELNIDGIQGYIVDKPKSVQDIMDKA